MAEQIPYDIVSSVINKLASFALREFGRIYGVKDELERLNTTLKSIEVVLSDAEQKQDQEDTTIEHWIRRFKEVLHDADDLLDDVAIQDLRHKVNGHGRMVSQVREFCSSQNPLYFRHRLACKVEKIRKKFDAVADDMSKLNLNPGQPKQNENTGRETGSVVLQSDIIGREENKKEIIELLKQTNTNQNVSLIAIVGIGGLGKTALAQLVYKDAQEQKLFDKWMWVCVSEDFEEKSIIKQMLKSLDNKAKVDDLELDQLQRMLQEELNGKKYMLVIDDVWNEIPQKWHDLRRLLICGGEGSKILVTTRSRRVSQTMDITNPHILKGLNEEQSWTLLKKLTIGEDANEMSPNKESIGKKIAEQCGGVPLAIRAVGGFLKLETEDHQWSSILNDDAWRLCLESTDITSVLKLSYKNLPLGLRQCFAYCCLFPKDWVIEKNELIQLWMAQGYLQSSNEMLSMEELGNQYVKILLTRSFFQDASLNEYNDIISFKMHDLMHDLATSVAGNDCYLDSEGKGNVVGRPIHVSFLGSTACSLDSLDVSKLRTLLARRNTSELRNLLASTIGGFVVKPSIIKNLKYLRVLDLSFSSITELPKSIDKCKHLRYLDLSFCRELISLPKSIGNLVCLQSLKLSGCERLAFCTKVITKLINLRHLDVDGCGAFQNMPMGIGQLTSLQSLSEFRVGDNEDGKCAKLNELKELNNIRGRLRINMLSLVNDVASESQEANLKAKKGIQFLELNWGKSEEVKQDGCLQLLDNLCPHQDVRKLSVCGYPGVRFSSWLPSLTNIVEIRLFDLHNCQQLPPLERLPQLKRLHIWNLDELKYMYYEAISHVFFPSLEKLILVECKKLEGWQRLANDVDNHHWLPPFSHLSYLDICDCPNLTCMPTYPHLVELRLDRCTLSSVFETCYSSFNPLSGLKFLSIGHDTDIEVMPEEWMQNLTSLERLSLSSSPTIAPILRHLQHLPAELQELKINRVDKLDLWKDEEDVSTQCQILHCLRSLQKISIGFSDMKALPEGICDLQSLRHIDIIYCRNLESLPEGMRCLTNLQTLSIRDCPLLYDRCQTETGEDWPKIAHIPNITVEPY